MELLLLEAKGRGWELAEGLKHTGSAGTIRYGESVLSWDFVVTLSPADDYGVCEAPQSQSDRGSDRILVQNTCALIIIYVAANRNRGGHRLVLYCVGSIVSHLRVGDVKGIGSAAFMLVLAAREGSLFLS